MQWFPLQSSLFIHVIFFFKKSSLFVWKFTSKFLAGMFKLMFKCNIKAEISIMDVYWWLFVCRYDVLFQASTICSLCYEKVFRQLQNWILSVRTLARPAAGPEEAWACVRFQIASRSSHRPPCWFDVFLKSCPICIRRRPSHNFGSPTEVLEIPSFLANCEWRLSFCQQWFPSSSSTDAQAILIPWVRRTRPAVLFAGFFCDTLGESSVPSWSNFAQLTTPGKADHCCKSSPFVDNGCHCGSLVTQYLRNGCVTLCRHIYINDYGFHPWVPFKRFLYTTGLGVASEIKLSL